MAKPEDEDLITQAEAARLRGVTRSAIAYLITEGRLKKHMRLGLPFVSRSEVMSYEPLKPGPKTKPEDNPTARKRSRKKGGTRP